MLGPLVSSVTSLLKVNVIIWGPGTGEADEHASGSNPLQFVTATAAGDATIAAFA
jgi:hypothetical protein